MSTVVAVCDDEPEVNAEIERVLLDIFRQRGMKYEIYAHFSGADLLAAMQSQHYDLIFLDIGFGQDPRNGLSVARAIRQAQKNLTVHIVFVSWNRGHSFDLHDFHPLGFLVKKIERDMIEKIVDRYLDISGVRNTHYVYKIGQDIYKTPVKDIAYIESSGRQNIIHFADGRRETVYGSIKQAVADLKGSDFLHIHSAYLVNYDHVTFSCYEHVELGRLGVRLNIGTARRKDIRRAFADIIHRRSL